MSVAPAQTNRTAYCCWDLGAVVGGRAAFGDDDDEVVLVVVVKSTGSRRDASVKHLVRNG